MTPTQKRLLRLGLLTTVLLAILFAGWVSGVTEDVTVARVRLQVEAAGGWGMFVYLAVFVIGVTVHVPGMIFVLTAAALWGRPAAIPLAYAGGLVAVVVSFLIVRVVGGTPFVEVERPLIKSILRRITDRPVLTIVLLRQVFWMGPVLNYGAALVPIRFRDYLLGSAVGLIPPVVGGVVLFQLFVE